MKYELFQDIPESTVAALLPSFPVWELGKGEFVRRQGAPNRSLYLVESGVLSIWKGPPATAEGVEIARVGPGACIGEMSVVRSSPASVSIVAAERARLREVDVDALPAAGGVKQRVLLNLAHVVATRLQQSETALRLAHGELAQLQTVVGPMAGFVHWNLVGLGACMFSLPLVQLAHLPPTIRALVSAALLAFFAVGVWRFVRRHHMERELLGLEVERVGRQVATGLGWSVPIAIACVLLKWTAIHGFGLARPLFESWTQAAAFGEATPARWFVYGAATVVLAGATEFVRCGLQSALAFSFRRAGRPASWPAVGVAAIACAAVEVHAGVGFAWMNLLLGLIWGALYTYRPWFLAIATSHAAVAFFAGFVLGFP